MPGEEGVKAVAQPSAYPNRHSSLAIYEELKAAHARPDALCAQREAACTACPLTWWHRPEASAPKASSEEMLVPIFLAVQGSTMVPPGPDLRENFLWRLGSEWDVASAAKRISAELGLGSELLVSDQIRNGLRRYSEWRDESRGRERLVEVELDVRVWPLRYRDRLLWDANAPQNAGGAADFAATVCADLGLSSEFAVAIETALLTQVEAKWAAVRSELEQRESQGLPTDPPTAAEWTEARDTRTDWSGPQLEWLQPGEEIAVLKHEC